MKCHYSVTIFVVPDQILEVASDLMEKYCISENRLHTMFDQLCFLLVKLNTFHLKCITFKNGLAWFQLLTILPLLRWT